MYYFLASDQLEGRNLPSRGYDTAALYVASHLAEWKLKPMGSMTGTNGPLQPYFQPFELVSRSIVGEESKASVTGISGGRGGGRGAGGGGGGGARGGAAGGGSAEFEFGKDWTAAAGGRGAPPVHAFDVTGNMVFAGNGYVMNKSGENPYNGLDVKGKIVVVAGVPAELAAQLAAGGGRGAAPAAGQPAPLQACTDYLNPEQAAAKNGAIAVVTIANFQTLAAMANPNAGFGGRGGGGRGPSLNGPAYQVAKFVVSQTCPTVPAITAGLEMTNAIFAGEKMSGQQVFYGAGSNAKQNGFALSDAKKITVHLAVHEEQNHAENVVGMLEGSDPVLKNEFVVISAHLDHIGFANQPTAEGHNINNGADDDGSGSTGLLGIARSYAEGAAKGIRPKRSIIFLWNAGEEKGLWGSQYFNEFPFIDLTKVVADLNIDMIGRTQESKLCR